ncbi:protoporphyrinogen oxidase [Bacillus sp. FSL W7-1360]
MTRKPRIAIIGAGITGLAAACWLEEHGFCDYDVFEASGRAGGKICTYDTDGFVIEGGPDSYLARKTRMTDFIRRIGLEDDLTYNHRGSAFVLKQGRLHETPKQAVLGIPTDLDLFSQTTLLSEEGKARVVKEQRIPRVVKDGGDISVGTFFRTRFGDEMVDVLIEPLLGGIYGGNIDELSMKATFPVFLTLEETYGSVIKGLQETRTKSDTTKKQGLFLTVRSGLLSVVAAASQSLRKDALHLNTVVTAIDKTESGTYRISFDGKDACVYDACIVTTPPKQAAALFVNRTPFSYVENMEATSCATVALTFCDEQVNNTHEGTGFVVARGGDEVITACTWTDQKWPHTSREGYTLLRAYVGRPEDESIVDASDEAIVTAVLSDLKKVMEIKGAPLFYKVTRFKQAMPQYKVGHVEEVTMFYERMAKMYPRVHVVGAAFQGVGLPDCVVQGEEAAKELVHEES